MRGRDESCLLPAISLSLSTQYSPNRSWIRESSAVAILYSDEIDALDSARSICESSDTLRFVRRDICFSVRSFSLRRFRIVSPMTLWSFSLLSQIERAESSASISSLYKIATALDARIQDLFGEY